MGIRRCEMRAEKMGGIRGEINELRGMGRGMCARGEEMDGEREREREREMKGLEMNISDQVQL